MTRGDAAGSAEHQRRDRVEVQTLLPQRTSLIALGLTDRPRCRVTMETGRLRESQRKALTSQRQQ